MKKLILSVALVFAASFMFGQAINTQNAYNALKDANRAKTAAEKLTYLENAKKYIDEAATNAETSSDAKTLYYKGVIYMNYYRYMPSKDEKIMSEGVAAFKKANELDTKKKYTDDILVNVDTMRQGFYNRGVAYFNNKDYANSMSSFEQGASLYSVINQVDTAMLLTAAVAAEKAERIDKAKDYYEAALQAGDKTPEVYYGLTVFYTKLKDKNNAMRVIKMGREQYPKNLELIKAETNMYLAFGEDDKAMEQLKVIAQNDTTNATVYFAMGSLYDKISNDTTKTKAVRAEAFNNALDSYNKAIKHDPNYFNAYYSAGILFNNVAAELLTKANNLPSDAVQQYNAMIADAEANLDKALPYLEKASQIDPKDESTLIALKQIYVRKKQTDKAKEINDKLNALKQK